MKKISAAHIGLIGEHLVCADLLRAGYDAFLVGEQLPYDVIAEINEKLIKIQVKTSLSYTIQTKRSIPVYTFSLYSGVKKTYTKKEIDIYALVSLDTGQVGYICVGENKTKIRIRIDAFKDKYKKRKGTCFSDITLEKILRKLNND